MWPPHSSSCLSTPPPPTFQSAARLGALRRCRGEACRTLPRQTVPQHLQLPRNPHSHLQLVQPVQLRCRLQILFNVRAPHLEQGALTAPRWRVVASNPKVAMRCGPLRCAALYWMRAAQTRVGDGADKGGARLSAEEEEEGGGGTASYWLHGGDDDVPRLRSVSALLHELNSKRGWKL